MKCPKCESENTQRLEVAFQGGTQNISTSSYSTGIGIGSGGRIGVGTGRTTTSGQSQSLLAQQVSPPAKKSYKWPAITLFFLAGLLGSIAQSFIGKVGGEILSLAIVGASGYLIYLRYQFNSKEWPGLYQHWSESWICHKCGGVYHQPT